MITTSTTPIAAGSVYTHPKWFAASAQGDTVKRADTVDVTVSFTPDRMLREPESF